MATNSTVLYLPPSGRWFAVPGWQPYPASHGLPSEVASAAQYRRVECGEAVVHVLVLDHARPVADLDALARAYVDGSLPRQSVDLSQFDLSRKDVKLMREANKERAAEERKAEKRARYVYDHGIFEGE